MPLLRLNVFQAKPAMPAFKGVSEHLVTPSHLPLCQQPGLTELPLIYSRATIIGPLRRQKDIQH